MDNIAINKRTALKMFWDAGYNTETLLTAANDKLNTLYSPTLGYYNADDVSKLIESNLIILEEYLIYA